MAATIDLNTSLSNIPYPKDRLLLYVRVLLCARVIRSGLCEKLCHLHYYDFRHSLNVIFFEHSTKIISHKFRHLQN